MVRQVPHVNPCAAFAQAILQVRGLQDHRPKRAWNPGHTEAARPRVACNPNPGARTPATVRGCPRKQHW